MFCLSQRIPDKLLLKACMRMNTYKCLTRTRSPAVWGRAPGPVAGVCVGEMKGAAAGKMSNNPIDLKKIMKWEHSKPADHISGIRPSRCGNKFKLKKTAKHEKVITQFPGRRCDCFSCSAVPVGSCSLDKSLSPSCFPLSNHTFLLWRLDVHDWSYFPLFGMTRDTC